jgi:hypothetical protein
MPQDHVTTVNGGDGRIRIYNTPEGNLLLMQGEGPDTIVKSYPMPDAQGGDGASLGDEPHKRITRAQQRLQRLREQAPFEAVRRVDVPGQDEPYFVKRGSFADMTYASALSGRDQNGHLILSDSEAYVGFMASLFRTFCVVSETDRTPYFESLADARAFVEDLCPLAGDAVGTLFYCIADMNPEVWPEGAAQAKNVWAALTQQPAPTPSSKLP